MALKNSDYPCELWDEWSRKSAKYRLGLCQSKWRTFGFSERPLTKASLYQWLKMDNYSLFVSLQSANREINGAFSYGTNAHVADAFYKINPTKYVFSSIEGWYVLQENNTWFQVGSTEASKIPSLFNNIRDDCCDVMYDILKNLPKGKEDNDILRKSFADTLKKIGLVVVFLVIGLTVTIKGKEYFNEYQAKAEISRIAEEQKKAEEEALKAAEAAEAARIEAFAQNVRPYVNKPALDLVLNK
jgi:hypothetical protein